jgi:hypothetical protein
MLRRGLLATLAEMSRKLPLHVASISILVATTAWTLAGVWRAGMFEYVPRAVGSATGEATTPQWQYFDDADTVFVAWLVARNARTITRSPTRLFDAEHCAPAQRTLAYGEPLFTMGMLAVPPYLVVRDPVATYNLALFSAFLVSALAMYLLVFDWTGAEVAALIAALLYAFNGERIADVTHAFAYDTAWIVFALYFARRWVEGGRWRDVAGMVGAGTLQIGTGFYPLLASLLATLPVSVYLAGGLRLTRTRIVQAAVIAASIGALAYAMFGPYLEVRATTEALRRDTQLFAAWSWFEPHDRAAITWTATSLAVLGLLLPIRGAAGATTARMWLRVTIALGAVLAAAASTGPNQPEAWSAIWRGDPPLRLPNVYAALSTVLPGLDAVRVPARIDTGYHLGLCLLAGMGTAALLSRCVRFAAPLAIAVLAVAALESAAMLAPLRPTSERAALLAVAPDASALAFFQSLEATGDTGPLLELPIGNADREYLFRGPRRIFLSFYHHRRTSACYGSFLPPGRAELRQDSLSLPDAGAADRLCARGFRTVVVHLDTALGQQQAADLASVETAIPAVARRLITSSSMVAFELCPDRDER